VCDVQKPIVGVEARLAAIRTATSPVTSRAERDGLLVEDIARSMGGQLIHRDRPDAKTRASIALGAQAALKSGKARRGAEKGRRADQELAGPSARRSLPGARRTRVQKELALKSTYCYLLGNHKDVALITP
jgi:hypothetical protein